MAIFIVLVFIGIVFFCWALCAASGKSAENDEYQYQKWLREQNRKDD